MLIQLLLLFFIIFAISRVLLQLKQGNLTFRAFLFWIVVFLTASIGVSYPRLTGRIAVMLGIGRGADVIIYVSIALLFYLIFRLSISIENIRHEISQLVREIALIDKKKGKK